MSEPVKPAPPKPGVLGLRAKEARATLGEFLKSKLSEEDFAQANRLQAAYVAAVVKQERDTFKLREKIGGLFDKFSDLGLGGPFR
jgi:hypothetical protein